MERQSVEVPADDAVCVADAIGRVARVANRSPEDVRADLKDAARFGAPTLEHYRRTYDAAGAGWPGEAFVRRHHPVAEGPDSSGR